MVEQALWDYGDGDYMTQKTGRGEDGGGVEEEDVLCKSTANGSLDKHAMRDM